MIKIILFSILFLSSCSLFDKETYAEAERQSRKSKDLDISSYWEHQFITIAKFYEVKCYADQDSFEKWIHFKGFETADQEIPSICSPVKSLGDHSGKCMPEQNKSTYKLKDIFGQTARIDFLRAGNRCFADIYILVDILKNKKKRTICHKGPSIECGLYISKLEKENKKLVRSIGGETNIYFKEIGFRGRLFNFYHFEASRKAFEEQEAYRSYSSSPY